MTKQGIVFLVGIVLFGLAYYPVRTSLGNDLIFVAVAVAYIIALRILGLMWERKQGRGPND